MKRAILVLVLATMAWGATSYTWNGGRNDVATNFTPEGIPVDGDDVAIGATATACSLMVSWHIDKFTIPLGFTAFFYHDTLVTDTIDGVDSINSGGACKIRGITIQPNNSNFYFKTAGADTIKSWHVDCQGTGNYTVDKTTIFGKQSIAASGKTTTIKNHTYCYNLATGGGTIAVDNDIYYAVACNSSSSLSGYNPATTITSFGHFYFQIADSAANFKIDIPKINASGVQWFVIKNGTKWVDTFCLTDSVKTKSMIWAKNSGPVNLLSLMRENGNIIS